MNKEKAIEVIRLRCGYQGRFMLQDLSFDVAKGEFMAVVGPNGAGKSTLLRALTGLLPVQKGMIRIEGKDSTELSHKKRARKIAVVNQFVDADSMTVEEYVLMGRLPYHSHWQLFETGKDYEIAEECMSLTGIIDKRDKQLDRLSGGEQQLAAIARALAQQTGILLLDEPTAHLDISHQMKILNLVRYLNEKRGITILLVIHDLNLASEFGNRLLMIEKGKVDLIGTPEEVLTVENIRKIYATDVLIRKNPISDKPYLFPVFRKHP